MSADVELENCRLCGSDQLDEPLILQEMMFGSREQFDYVRCRQCDTMQIVAVPQDMGRYYPSTYYSFGNVRNLPWHRRFARKMLVLHMLGKPSTLPKGVSGLDRLKSKVPYWLAAVPGLTRDCAILDVGSGEGARLMELGNFGFSDLHGLDPFLPADVNLAPSPAINLHREELLEHQGQYDLVMMHHSLEHVPDPLALLRAARSHVAAGGHLLVRVPLRQGEAWREYGHDWVHLDPPRHLFHFSHSGLVEMAGRAGFELVRSGFDTNAHSYAWSELYRGGIPMFEDGVKPNSLSFSQQQMKEFELRALRANAKEDADLGYFVFR